MDPEGPLLAGLPARGNLVLGACLLGGAARKLPMAAPHGMAAGHLVVRSEAMPLNEWYRRSLRFRPVSTVPGGGTPAGSSSTAAAASRQRPAGGSGTAAPAGGSCRLYGAAAGKRPAPWSPGEDMRGPGDQQHQRRLEGPRPAPLPQQATLLPPHCHQQQYQQQQVKQGQQAQWQQPGLHAAPPLAPPGVRATVRVQHFSPEQLQAKTARELSDLLKARGQSAAGRKEALVLRLLDFQRRVRRAMQPAA